MSTQGGTSYTRSDDDDDDDNHADLFIYLAVM